jgi:predicted dehydrogenase
MVAHCNRRGFLKSAAAGGMGLLILPDSRSAFGYSANEKLNLVVIGAGGRGQSNIAGVSSENIIALCDVDERRAADSFNRFSQAKKYHDFRKMLDQLEQQIDGVVVSAANHIHAPASVMAMRMGKHVYCEKPGAHSVHEARVMAQVASQQKVATQLGTQIHATENFRRIVELIQGGAIGSVTECHIWLRSGRGGLGDRPRETPPVPKGLDWDLFLGPAAQRTYHSTYVKGSGGNWHWWWDFGGGELGNIGCHYLDLPFWALELTSPVSIEANGPPPHPESTPARQHVRYEFPSRDNLPPVTLTWTHGDQPPPIFREHAFPDWAWGVFVGSQGMLLVNYPQRMLWPEEKFAEYQPPEPSIPSSPGHHQEWILACKTGSPTGCHFGYSSPIAETVLLGNVAYRRGQPGGDAPRFVTLEWDAARFQVTNDSAANDLLQREYRPGWTL